MSTTPVSLAALGVGFTVHGLPAADADRFRRLWAPCLTAAPSPDEVAVTLTRSGGGWQADADGQVTEVTGDDAALAAACAAVNTSATSRTPLIASHAAVVSRGVVTAVLPGASGAGKTTLTLALLRRGWAYASDEAFAVDRVSGAVRHYARPLAAEGWTVDRFGLADLGVRSGGEWYLAARDVGAAVDLTPGAPSVIVLFDRSAQPTSLRPVHRMDGLEELLRRCFTMHVDPVSTLRVLATITRAAEVVRLSGDDPDAAAEELDELVC